MPNSEITGDPPSLAHSSIEVASVVFHMVHVSLFLYDTVLMHMWAYEAFAVIAIGTMVKDSDTNVYKHKLSWGKYLWDCGENYMYLRNLKIIQKPTKSCRDQRSGSLPRQSGMMVQNLLRKH